MWSWMENTYNKMRRRRKNNKIVEEGNVVKKGQLAFVDYFNRIFNLNPFAIILIKGHKVDFLFLKNRV